MMSPGLCGLGLALWLRGREFPATIQDLGTGTIEPHHVVPASRDRDAVRDLAVAAAELDCDRAIISLVRGNVVECVAIQLVRNEIALGVVDADRPEAIDGLSLYVEFVDCGAI